SQQRKPWVDDAVGPADLPHRFVPSQCGITSILYHHGFHRRSGTELSELLSRHIADAYHFRLSTLIQPFDGDPPLPVRISQALPLIRPLQHVGVEIVGV